MIEYNEDGSVLINVHPTYAAMRKEWREARDFIAGENALKKHDLDCKGAIGTAYLPKKSIKQTDDSYASFVDSALYYNGVGLTVEGLLGLVFQKVPDIVVPASGEVLVNDVDMEGTPLIEFAAKLVREILSTSRAGVLVDYTNIQADTTKAEEERIGVRSFMVMFKAEEILDWAQARIDNVMVLSRVVLKGPVFKNKDNKLDSVKYVAYIAKDKLYHMARYRRESLDSPYILESDILVRVNDSYLDYIPFWFFSPIGGSIEPVKPYLQDLIKVNRAHYRNSAALEHGIDYCGNPSPVLAGFPELARGPNGTPVTEIMLGSDSALITMDPQAHWGFLEFTGQGLLNIERALDRKEKLMAHLGSRMLFDDKKGAEAAETFKIRFSGESATLADIAGIVSRILSQAFSFACKWLGASSPGLIALNTDYVAHSIDPNEIVAITGAYQAGTLPLKDYIRRMKDIGEIKEDRKVEEVIKELEAKAKEAEAKAKAEVEAAEALKKANTTQPSGDV